MAHLLSDSLYNKITSDLTKLKFIFISNPISNPLDHTITSKNIGKLLSIFHDGNGQKADLFKLVEDVKKNLSDKKNDEFNSVLKGISKELNDIEQFIKLIEALNPEAINNKLNCIPANDQSEIIELYSGVISLIRNEGQLIKDYCEEIKAKYGLALKLKDEENVSKAEAKQMAEKSAEEAAYKTNTWWWSQVFGFTTTAILTGFSGPIIGLLGRGVGPVVAPAAFGAINGAANNVTREVTIVCREKKPPSEAVLGIGKAAVKGAAGGFVAGGIGGGLAEHAKTLSGAIGVGAAAGAGGEGVIACADIAFEDEEKFKQDGKVVHVIKSVGRGALAGGAIGGAAHYFGRLNPDPKPPNGGGGGSAAKPEVDLVNGAQDLKPIVEHNPNLEKLNDIAPKIKKADLSKMKTSMKFEADALAADVGLSGYNRNVNSPAIDEVRNNFMTSASPVNSLPTPSFSNRTATPIVGESSSAFRHLPSAGMFSPSARDNRRAAERNNETSSMQLGEMAKKLNKTYACAMIPNKPERSLGEMATHLQEKYSNTSPSLKM